MSGPWVMMSPAIELLSEITVGDIPSRSDSLRFGSAAMKTPLGACGVYNKPMSQRSLVTLFAITLLSLSACSREKSDWRSAQAADSPESYEQFIAAHPDSTLVGTARERLVQLAEEKDWRTAAGLDTIEAYRQFLA